MKILKDLEYLIPLFTGMPNWVKASAFIWALFSIFLLFTIASISYTKNKEKDQKEKAYIFKVAKMQIKRSIEDYDLSSKNIVGQFPQEVGQIDAEFNMQGTFHSGMRIRKLWKTAKEYKEKIDAEYRTFMRKIEDILLENIKQKEPCLWIRPFSTSQISLRIRSAQTARSKISALSCIRP